AIDEGRFKREIEPVPVFDENGNKRMFDTDEHPRRNTSLEKLASLPPAFKPDGRITAGNSSGINDGACALLVTSPEKAKELRLEPRARLVSTGVAGTNPTIMLDGTIPAIRKALARAHVVRGRPVNPRDISLAVGTICESRNPVVLSCRQAKLSSTTRSSMAKRSTAFTERTAVFPDTPEEVSAPVFRNIWSNQIAHAAAVGLIIVN